MKIFSERLTILRGQKKQGTLAKELGIAQSTLSNYEKNIREPDLSTLCDIAKVLNVSADYLLGLTDDPHGHFGSEQHSASISKSSIEERLSRVEAILEELSAVRKR